MSPGGSWREARMRLYARGGGSVFRTRGTERGSREDRESSRERIES